MRRSRLWLGMMVIIMLVAGQAWAATAVPPGGLGLLSTSTTGSYSVTISASSTPGANYVLEESTDNFATAPTSYALGTTRGKAFTKANGTYYYRAYVTAIGYTNSAPTAVKSIVVTLTVAPPGGLGLVSTSSTGSYTVTISASPTATVNYVLQEDDNSGFTSPTEYALGTARFKSFTGKAGGTYYYRAKATKATYADSAWTATASIVVSLATALPNGINVVPSSANGSYTVSVGTSTTAGANYVLEEATDAAFTTDFASYALGTTLYKAFSGKAASMYYYRAKATSATADSPYTTVASIAVGNSASCPTCHAGTQTVWSAGAHGNGNALPAGYKDDCAACHATSKELVGGNMAVTCTVCHKPGVPASGNHTAQAVASQLTTCTACHNTANAHQNTISDTHADSAATATVIEGYNFRAATACSDCHGHQGKTAIHDAWAGSAHAGRLTAEIPDTAKVWGHYDWDSAGRAACQRCHTATGAMNFLTNPATYNAASNTFTHLAAGQNELLYCWGCHTSVETGALRNPGAITESYAATSNTGTGTTGTPVTVVYPDLNQSNLCMGCHLGREVGANITNTTDGVGTNAGDVAGMLGFINSHYLTAGATLFNQSGYEYAGQSYDSYGYHKNVGQANAFNTGTAGPCVTCHMTGAEGHSFEVVTKDATDTITAVASSECSKCHGGLTAAVLETSKVNFHTAMEELKLALEDQGIYFYEAHPYFYTAPYVVGGTNTAFTNWAGVYGEAAWKNVMGAAFNYNLLEHDPGAYAHNRGYVLKLIQDSVDFLADGAVDGLGIPADLRAAITNTSFSGSTTWAGATHPSETDCSACHMGINSAYATSQHKTKQGKATWYTDHLGNTDPLLELQTGFGNYTTVAYNDLPCKNCHNSVDNGPWDSNPVVGTNTQAWPGANCTECHSNRTTYGVQSTSVTADVTKNTCYGCHSRQKKEAAATASGGAGLTDVHYTAGMGCKDCHATADFHGTGEQTASQLEWGTISAQCENCHGEGKAQGPLSQIGEHMQHLNDVACSTCHAESMVTCNNCHFDNEMGGTGITKLKFASGFFGGTKASGKSWRFLVNRVMEDGSTKVYPGSMQSLYTDVYAKNSPGSGAVPGEGDDIGWTHAGIAPYYSHSITKVNALKCADCHGTQNAVDLNNGLPIRVITWLGTDTETVAPASLGTKLKGPSGIIPVPENPKGKLLMDFVDLVDPDAAINATSDNIVSYRKLAKRDGPDSIHMPEAYVKPLTALQIQKLAEPQFDHTSAVATTSTPLAGYDTNTCKGCHQATNTTFATSLHYTRQGKDTFYSHNLGNAGAAPLQKGFGNYVNVSYSALPCADCHNAAAWNAGSGDTWAAETGGNPVCTDCHTNKVSGAATTAFDAPVTKNTCIGCHSRQATETSLGLTDVHTSGAVINGTTMNFTCPSCHAFSDMHGSGTAKASQLADGAVSAKCENCHTTMAGSTTPEHSQHLSDVACSTCHMESVITCYGCHFDNEASDPADSTILHAKFASGKFGGTAASGKAWRFLVNRVMGDGSTKVYPASMQSLVADRTAANAPGEDNQGWTHAAIAPYYSHSITKVNALRCDKCHGIQNAIDLANNQPIRVVRWNANAGVQVPVTSMMATYTAPSGVIPVPENPVGKLLMDFVDLVNPAAGPLNASGTSPSARILFKADGPDSIHMPDAYVTPLTPTQIDALATPQIRP